MSRYEYRFLNSVQSKRYYDRNVIIYTIQAMEEWIGRNSRKKIFFRRPDDRYTPLPTGIITQKARCILIDRENLSRSRFSFLWGVSFR